MTVKNYVLKDVKQTKANAIEAVIAGATKNVKPADIKIVNTANNVTYAVKEITVDEKDSTKATITTYMNMTDGKEYKVTIDGVDKTFTASDGKVVAAGLEKTEIVAATATKINAVLKDAQGVVLDTIAYPGDGKTTISINVINGYTTADSLYLNKVGDTATADVVYHSGQYDSNGNETGNVEAKGITITAIAAETVTVNGWAVKVGDAGKSFDKVTETKVAVGDKKVAYIQMTNSKNEKITNLSDYTVESSNKDALIINTTDLSKGEVVFSAVKEGTTYLLVKDNKGNVVTTLPITITAARKATTLELDKKDITLSTSILEKAKIAVTLKDQYGEKLSAPSTVELKTLTYNDGKKTVNTDKTFDNATAGVTDGKFDVDSTGKNEGTYVVKVTSNNLSQTFTVAIKTAKTEKPDKSNVSYTLDMPTSSADAIIKDDASSNTEITANVYKLVEGVKAAQIADTEMVVTLKKGNDNYNSRLNVSTTGKITITVADKSTGVKLPAGTYTLEVKDVNTTKPAFAFTRNIVITDTQPAVSVKRVGGVKEAAEKVNDCFEFSYNDKKFEKYNVISIKYYNSKNELVTDVTGQDVAVAYAIVEFDLSSNVRLQQKVNIGLTVTIK